MNKNPVQTVELTLCYVKAEKSFLKSNVKRSHKEKASSLTFELAEAKLALKSL